jgi:DNA repair protein RadA/Sms
VGRARDLHRCGECGAVSLRWAGRCPTCGAWNALVEEPGPDVSGTCADAAAAERLAARQPAAPVELAGVDLEASAPIETGIGELDRVLSGGLLPGSVTLLGGPPGIGKSTLLLQCLSSATGRGVPSMLVAAEESGPQVRRRAERLGAAAPGLQLLVTTDLRDVCAAVGEHRPRLVVVDSIQTLADPAVGPAAGTLAQVRECAAALVRLARERETAVVLAGHVTKEGALAGPRALEHVVDSVLEFEGERHHALRLLSATKHRFGGTDELGVFEMTRRGLVGIADPSGLLLSDRHAGVAGSVVVPVLEGRRSFLVELQALVSRSSAASSRRSAEGLRPGRLALLLAVLERRLRVDLREFDVFASIVGGIRVAEPSADLGLALALVSAVSGAAIAPDVVACGEVGLSGEVRQVRNIGRRLGEASRLGFRRAVVPMSAPAPGGETGTGSGAGTGPGAESGSGAAGGRGMELLRVRTVADAVDRLLLAG